MNLTLKKGTPHGVFSASPSPQWKQQFGPLQRQGAGRVGKGCLPRPRIHWPAQRPELAMVLICWGKIDLHLKQNEFATPQALLFGQDVGFWTWFKKQLDL